MINYRCAIFLFLLSKYTHKNQVVKQRIDFYKINTIYFQNFNMINKFDYSLKNFRVLLKRILLIKRKLNVD